MRDSKLPQYSELEAELLRSAALDVAPAGLHERLDTALLAGAAAVAAAGAATTHVTTAAVTQASAGVAHGALAATPMAAGAAIATSPGGAAMTGVVVAALKWVGIVAATGALSWGVVSRVRSPAAATPPAVVAPAPSGTSSVSERSTSTVAWNSSATPTPTSNATSNATSASNANPLPTAIPLTPQSASEDLTRELQLIDEARAGLARGDSARTIERLDRYDLNFPAPHLAAEALALRVEAYALRQDHERVDTLARTFLTRYPQHPLAARVKLLASGK
jgi:hypothetical protein